MAAAASSSSCRAAPARLSAVACVAPDAAALDRFVRPALRAIKAPAGDAPVHNDECMVSVDAPFSPDGLFVNLATHQGFGRAHLGCDRAHDAAASTPTLYAWVHKYRVPRVPGDDADAADAAAAVAAPTKMAIGVDGGFKTDDQKYETVTTVHLHARLGASASATFAFPDPRLPEYVSTVAAAVASHVASAVSAGAAAWEEEIKVSRYAADLPLDASISSGAKTVVDIADPSAWACEDCGVTENLWLNLSDGYIGSGRRNWDGSGGTGAAKRHYEELLASSGGANNYPLVVKLGTITPDGRGDVYSYAADEDDAVVDPQLPAHLARLGIDVKRLAKTEKSTAELQIELNLNYNFSEVTEEGATLVPVRAPNFVGLANLGNTCYVNSTVQCLMALPEFAEHYRRSGAAWAAAGTALGLAPQDDVRLQLGKLSHGLHTDTYVVACRDAARALRDRDAALAREASGGGAAKDGEAAAAAAAAAGGQPAEEEAYVSPSSLRTLLGKGHPEFSTAGQQDAAEFLEHVCNLLAKTAREQYQDPAEDLSRLFRFSLEDRMQTGDGKVKYEYTQQDVPVLRLNIPVAAVDNGEAVAAYEARVQAAAADEAKAAGGKQAEGKEQGGGAGAGAGGKRKRAEGKDGEEEKPVLPNVPFPAVLDQFAAPSSFAFRGGQASRTTRFVDFPNYLWVHMGRYTLQQDATGRYGIVKLKHTVTPPLELDLSALTGTGPQPGEQMLEEDGGANAGAAAAAGPVPDDAVVQALVGMGFSENAGKRAALATSNAGPGPATEWIFGHMEDPDLNDPLPAAGGGGGGGGGGSAAGGGAGGADPAMVAQICAMGFTSEQAALALKQPGCAADPNNAVMWLFGNQADLPALLAADAAQQAALASGNAAFEAAAEAERKARAARRGKFELVGFISHVGKNTGSGHYVCHIRKQVPGSEGLQWVIHNDRKVALSQNPPLAHGYMYLYRCVE